MKISRVLAVTSACLGLTIFAGCQAPTEKTAKAGDVNEARVTAESAAERTGCSMGAHSTKRTSAR